MSARPNRWNSWYLGLLEAQAQLLQGDAQAAAAAASNVLAMPLANRSAALYRDYIGSMVLAWSGRHEQAVELLEALSGDAPSIPPAFIADDPRFLVPLAGSARFAGLRGRLEAKMAANRLGQ